MAQNYAFLNSNNQFSTYNQNPDTYTLQTQIAVGDALGDNVSINSTAIIVQNSSSNSIVGISTLSLSNSTSNALHTPASILIQNSSSNSIVGISTLSLSNSTSNALHTPASILIQNTTYSTSVNLSSLTMSNGTINVGNSTTNVSVNTSQITVTNGSAYINIAANGISLSSPLTIGTTVINSTSITTGNLFSTVTVNTATINATTLIGNTLSIGLTATNTFINTTAVTTSNLYLTGVLKANGALGTGSQLLTSNATGGVYWASPAAAASTVGSSANTNMLFNDSGNANGTAGFTFTKASNNVTIANTLTVGGAAVTNSTGFYISTSIANSSGFFGTASNTGNVFITSGRLSLSSGVPIYLNGSAGTSGYVLTSGGSGANPTWTLPSSFSSGTSYTWSASQAFNSGMSWSSGASGDTLTLVKNSPSTGAVIFSNSSGSVGTGVFGVSYASSVGGGSNPTTYDAGVVGYSPSPGSAHGVIGVSVNQSGVVGLTYASSGTYGVYGSSNGGSTGVYGYSASGYGITGISQSFYSGNFVCQATALQNSFYVGNNASYNFIVNNIGGAAFAGNLSKASGSFRIDHPHPSKNETHHLVHSFIEGPKADLIYRGTAQLHNGLAKINIDKESNMTEGTFELLCQTVQCFTTNESDWDNVKGFVNGNILTVQSQNNNSSSIISWMVIGERKDQHMIEHETFTDKDGHVIVEPLKETHFAHNSFEHNRPIRDSIINKNKGI